MAKKPPVTSANSRQERIKKTGKAPASTPKGRQTSAMQRPFKPGTKTSNTTTKFAGQKSLPAAGQSGGSQSPKGTTAPRRGGPVRTPAQLAQERRSAAASRKAGAGVGTRASNAAPTTAKGNKPNIVTKGLSKAGSPKGAGAGAVVEFINQLPEELRRARTGYYNLFKPNADRYNNLKNALGGVDPAKYFGTKLSGKGPTPVKPKAKPGLPALKGSMVNGKIQMTQVAKPKAKPAAKPKPAATTSTRSSAPSRSSAPARSTAPARTTASRPAAKPAAKPKATTTLRPDTVQGVGPIKSGDTYSRNIKKQSDVGKNFAGSKDMPNAAATYNTKTSYGTRVNSSFSAESPAAKPSASSKKSSAMTQAEILKRRRGF